MAEREGFWRRLVRRFTSSNEELVDEDLERDARSHGAKPVADAQVRERVTLRGAIASLTLSPREGYQRLEAELRDGSGSIVLIWMGRRTIPGLDVGRTVTVEGTLTISGGRRVMFNPRYELAPSQ